MWKKKMKEKYVQESFFLCYLFKPLPFPHLMQSPYASIVFNYYVCVFGSKSNVREKYFLLRFDVVLILWTVCKGSSMNIYNYFFLVCFFFHSYVLRSHYLQTNVHNWKKYLNFTLIFAAMNRMRNELCNQCIYRLF